MTNRSRYIVSPGVVIEKLGQDFMVFVPGTEQALTVSGDSAKALHQVQTGQAIDVSGVALSELVRLGVVQTASGMSRRGLVRVGAIGAGASIAALAMPNVATASSSNLGGGGGGGGGSPTLATFQVVSIGSSGDGTTASSFTITVEGEDTDGNLYTLGRAQEIPVNTTGDITFANPSVNNGNPVTATILSAGSNRFEATFSILETDLRNSGNRIAFTFNNVLYVISFP